MPTPDSEPSATLGRSGKPRGENSTARDEARASGRESTRLIVAGPDGALDSKPEGADLRPQAPAGDPQDARRPNLIPLGFAEDSRQEGSLHQGERLGVKNPAAKGYNLPEPDALIGATRGWLPETIDRWNAARPGRGVGGGRPRKHPEE